MVWGYCVTEKTGLLRVEEKVTLKNISRERNVHRSNSDCGSLAEPNLYKSVCRLHLLLLTYISSPEKKHAHRCPLAQLKMPVTQKKYIHQKKPNCAENTNGRSLRRSPCRTHADALKVCALK